MKTFYISCIVLCAFTSLGYSLECYRCTDCLPGSLSFLQDVDKCSDKFLSLDKAKCYKNVKEDGTINRGCTTDSTCLRKELINKCSNADETDCFICCGGNKCNTGSAFASSIVVCIASLLVFLVLL